jgi:hypothetical protein
LKFQRFSGFFVRLRPILSIKLFDGCIEISVFRRRFCPRAGTAFSPKSRSPGRSNPQVLGFSPLPQQFPAAIAPALLLCSRAKAHSKAAGPGAWLIYSIEK